MKRPNILFIFADQLRYDSLGCNGNNDISTPAIDNFAAQSLTLDNAFSCSPICSPYRGQLLSGCYNHVNGVICNEYRMRNNQQTIADVLNKEGYRTAYVGKLHLGSGPYDTAEKRLGFEDMIAYNCSHHYYNVSYWHNEKDEQKIKGYAPHGETDLALQTIKKYRAETPDKPFCMFLSWGPPHWSGCAGEERDYGIYPPEYDVYNPDSLHIPDNIPAMLRSYERREFADYYAMITSLDDCMAKLLAGLDKMGVKEETIVCFSSDHGDHLGAHGYAKPAVNWLPPNLRPSKATPYEEAIHIPFIIRIPGKFQAGKRSQTMFASVDVMPTLLGLCDIDAPAGMQGHDLSSALTGIPQNQPDSIFLQILGPGWPNRFCFSGLWRGVRTERYTYARYNWPDRRCILFDLETDPLEMTNLASDPDSKRILNEMEERLQTWLNLTDDPFDTGKRLPDTGMLDLGQRFINRKWYDAAPSEYSASIKKYF